MEFDFKKSRQQRIKRDRRTDKRQTAGTEIEAKNNTVTKQEKIKPQNGNNVADNVSKKPVDVTDVDPNFYARLKRETDDIAALKSKKPVNRQVFSSWSKLEQPIPNVEESNQLPDFETLLCSSQGGHFRFKAEKLWDIGLSPGSYSELFTANIDLLSAGISCVPFYKRLDLDNCLFNEEEIETMHTSAKHNMLNYENERQKKKKCIVTVNNAVTFLENKIIENESANTTQLNFKVENTDSEDLEKADMNFFKPENFIRFKKTNTNFEKITENESSQKVTGKIDSPNSNTDGKSIRPDSSFSRTLHNNKSSSDCVQETFNNENSKSITNDLEEDKLVIQKVISVEKSDDKIHKSASKENDITNLTVNFPEPTSTDKGRKEYSNIENPSKIGDELPVSYPAKFQNESDSRNSNSDLVPQSSMNSGKVNKNISDSGDKDNLDSLLTLKGKKSVERSELEAIINQTDNSASLPQCEIEKDEMCDHLPPVIATAKKEDLEDWLDGILDD